MKKIYLIILLLFTIQIVFSQNVGIGNNNPQSKLHVTGAIRSDTLIYTGTPVRHVFAAPNGRVYDSIVPLADWQINGNANIGATNFLGTTNANDLIFRTNNIETARFTSAGKFGIGTAIPNISSIVEMASTTGGLLIPRMTTVQRTAIATPANGLLVYDITVNCLYFYNAGLAVWQSMCTPPLPAGTNDVSGTYPALTVVGLQTTAVSAVTPTLNQILQFNGASWAPTNGTFWNLLGNTGTTPAINFLGTTDANDFVFRTNNTEKARVLVNGNVGIGTAGPVARLDVLLNSNTSAAPIAGFERTGTGSVGFLRFFSGATAGDYNGITQTGDKSIIFTNDNNPLVSNNSGLVIAPWTTGGNPNLFSGIKIMENGNVGVGTGVPQAALDVVSTTNGFAMPRMTSIQRKAIVAPIVGLQVYDINLLGFYYWDGTKWDCANNPAGTVQYFANTTAPNGYLVCDGSAVNRTTYAELFAAIGITYGAGNGTTTFNLPDLRGEFIRSLDAGKGVDPARNIGTWQSPSPIVHDDTGGAPAQDTDFSMDVNAQTYCDTWPTATAGGIPSAYWGRGNAASPVGNWVVYAGATAQGMIGAARPRNVALMACIKY